MANQIYRIPDKYRYLYPYDKFVLNDLHKYAVALAQINHLKWVAINDICNVLLPISDAVFYACHVREEKNRQFKSDLNQKCQYCAIVMNELR